MSLSGKKGLLLWLGLLLLAIACKNEEAPQTTPSDTFDKTVMLTHYADNLIIPAYTGLQQQLQTLETPLVAFLETPTTANQEALKPVFKEAYLRFERISVYQFGPAETALLNNFLNTFPADVTAIENNIGNGTYNLAVNSSVNQQGLPALDYLLFASDALQQLSSPPAANRKKYVQDALARMKTLVNTVLTDWQSTYRTQFIANTRTDVGSPIGYMVNQFAYEMDQLKGPRIGWPYGKQSGGVIFADKTEAYYSGFSVALAVENLSNLKKAYVGDGSGKSISGYLIALKKEELNMDVLQQFDVALDKLKAIPDPLSSAFTSHKERVDAAYKEIQSLLTLIKTDVASATGVRITYQDSDGD